MCFGVFFGGLLWFFSFLFSGNTYKHMRTAVKSVWIYIKLKIWTKTCNHQHKTGNSICRTRKQANFLASHPIKTISLVKTILIEELIINQPTAILY